MAGGTAGDDPAVVHKCSGAPRHSISVTRIAGRHPGRNVIGRYARRHRAVVTSRASARGAL
jgi:hypothetical protein